MAPISGPPTSFARPEAPAQFSGEGKPLGRAMAEVVHVEENAKPLDKETLRRQLANAAEGRIHRIL